MNRQTQIIFVPAVGSVPGDFAATLQTYQDFYKWVLKHGVAADAAGEKIIRIDSAELHRAAIPVLVALERLFAVQARHGGRLDN